MKDIRETDFNIISGDDYISFFSSDSKWCKRILKLKDMYPDKVEIRVINEDGSFTARLPVEWLKIKPKKQSTRRLSEQEKIDFKARMIASRNKDQT